MSKLDLFIDFVVECFGTYYQNLKFRGTKKGIISGGCLKKNFTPPTRNCHQQQFDTLLNLLRALSESAIAETSKSNQNPRDSDSLDVPRPLPECHFPSATNANAKADVEKFEGDSGVAEKEAGAREPHKTHDGQCAMPEIKMSAPEYDGGTDLDRDEQTMPRILSSETTQSFGVHQMPAEKEEDAYFWDEELEIGDSKYLDDLAHTIDQNDVILEAMDLDDMILLVEELMEKAYSTDGNTATEMILKAYEDYNTYKRAIVEKCEAIKLLMDENDILKLDVMIARLNTGTLEHCICANL